MYQIHSDNSSATTKMISLAVMKAEDVRATCQWTTHRPSNIWTAWYQPIPLLGAPHPTKTTSACPALAARARDAMFTGRKARDRGERAVWKAKADNIAWWGWWKEMRGKGRVTPCILIELLIGIIDYFGRLNLWLSIVFERSLQVPLPSRCHCVLSKKDHIQHRLVPPDLQDQ